MQSVLIAAFVLALRSRVASVHISATRLFLYAKLAVDCRKPVSHWQVLPWRSVRCEGLHTIDVPPSFSRVPVCHAQDHTGWCHCCGFHARGWDGQVYVRGSSVVDVMLLCRMECRTW